MPEAVVDLLGLVGHLPDLGSGAPDTAGAQLVKLSGCGQRARADCAARCGRGEYLVLQCRAHPPHLEGAAQAPDTLARGTPQSSLKGCSCAADPPPRPQTGGDGPSRAASSFAVFHLDSAGRLTSVEALASPREAMAGTRWLSQGVCPDPLELGDPEVPLARVRNGPARSLDAVTS
ncbi:oxidoreductase C-terminal domain-containing protein [Streptomyces sp. NPDC088353]|uniref:oxidoreductase C-terminal domain-containing protein n=1 Tax=Streptomyces sp. NPDC088353 TaxID=3365855 RepID=UPI0038260C80